MRGWRSVLVGLALVAVIALGSGVSGCGSSEGPATSPSSTNAAAKSGGDDAMHHGNAMHDEHSGAMHDESGAMHEQPGAMHDHSRTMGGKHGNAMKQG